LSWSAFSPRQSKLFASPTHHRHWTAIGSKITSRTAIPGKYEGKFGENGLAQLTKAVKLTPKRTRGGSKAATAKTEKERLCTLEKGDLVDQVLEQQQRAATAENQTETVDKEMTALQAKYDKLVTKSANQTKTMKTLRDSKKKLQEEVNETKGGQKRKGGGSPAATGQCKRQAIDCNGTRKELATAQKTVGSLQGQLAAAEATNLKPVDTAVTGKKAIEDFIHQVGMMKSIETMKAPGDRPMAANN
jgi:chromosome segregation ATPase